MKSTSNAEETKCSCNHMTHLAVLLHDSDGNSKVKCTLPLGSMGAGVISSVCKKLPLHEANWI